MDVVVKLYPERISAGGELFLLIRVRNTRKGYKWFEALVEMPSGISFSPHFNLRKGRIRLGILRRSEYIEKALKLYSMSPASGEMVVRVYAYDKEGVVEERKEIRIGVNVFPKEEEVMV